MTKATHALPKRPRVDGNFVTEASHPRFFAAHPDLRARARQEGGRLFVSDKMLAEAGAKAPTASATDADGDIIAAVRQSGAAWLKSPERAATDDVPSQPTISRSAAQAGPTSEDEALVEQILASQGKRRPR